MSKYGTNLRICYLCHVPHYENCPTCWGFGIDKNGRPLTARDAKDGKKSSPCPTCGGDYSGVDAALIDIVT